MPGTFGRTVLSSTGIPTQVTADGSPEWKVGGITIDWATVTAEVSDRTLTDGTVIKAGAKGLEYGTILCAKDVAEVQAIAVDATGGTFTLTGNGNTTAALAYNASTATVQAAIRGLGGAYAQAVVTGSASAYTVTYPVTGGDITALTANSASLTGNTHTATITTSTAGSAAGTYGPYASNATDGRQTLARGLCYILNETVTELGPLGLGEAASNHPGVFDGGRVWRARLKIGGDNPTSIGGSQPSVSAFESAFPRIKYVDL